MKKTVFKKRKKEKELEAFLKLLLLLTENGFSFTDSLQIMNRNKQVSEPLLRQFTESLNKGNDLMQSFLMIGCSSKEVSQIQFSMIHGNFVRTLETIVSQRVRFNEMKQEVTKALSYPMMLFTMLFMLLFLIRELVLPDLLKSNFLNSDHPGVRFIQWFPYIFFFFVLIFSLVFIGIKRASNKQSPLKIALLISRLPFIGSLYSDYQTSYFTQEWGHLYQQGLENKELLECMMNLPKQTLMNEMAIHMQTQFLQGISFSTLIKDYTFLTMELSTIIYQGEVTGKLGEELLIYSQLMLNQFTERVNKFVKSIQPILFILLAVLIISIYASLLKPLYSNLGGMNK